MSSGVSSSPPRAPPVNYTAPHGTRWAKEKAAAGQNAFDFPDDPRFVGPWIIGECVGKGASGRVRIAKHRTTGELAAIKILPIQPLFDSRASLATKVAKSDKQRFGIDREIAMMKLMNHPNIMRIYDVYEGEKELYLVLEYVQGGELFDFLVNRGRLPPYEALCYFKQIIYGLNYAHTFSIIHRDLKPENILIHNLDPPLIKIADWGMAAFSPPSHKLETSCGSPHYASPEIVNGERYNGTSTDIWSCGVILFALLTGKLPFDDKNVRNLLSKVKSGKYEMPLWVDPQAKDLISRMLVVDVSQRITILEILQHPWLLTHTEGVHYVPAPSPIEIARPLPCVSEIDPSLLESLRIIWGRHTDPWAESIKNDLLSPAGEGTLTKAFYFLLTKHNERVQSESDGNMIASEEEKHIVKQYVAPPPMYLTFPSSRDEKRSSHSRSVEPPASEHLSPSNRSPAPSSPIDIAHCHERTAVRLSKARSRTSSPAGPRPLAGSVVDSHRMSVDASTSKLSRRQTALAESAVLVLPHQPTHSAPLSFGDRQPQERLTKLPNETFLRTQQSPTHRRRTRMEHYPPISQRPLSLARAHPQFTSPEAKPMTWFSSFGTPIGDSARSPTEDPYQDSSLKSTPASPVIHAPIPVIARSTGFTQAARQLALSPPAQAGDANNSESSHATHTDAVSGTNVLGARVNTMQMEKNVIYSPSKPPKNSPSKPPRKSRGAIFEEQRATEKENVSFDIDETGWINVNCETSGSAVGLGFDRDKQSRKFSAVDDNRGKKAHIPTLKPRRSTISLLASPIVLSPPVVSSSFPFSKNPFVSSPHLADPKRGWFSQLFHRKGHNNDSCILYSKDDLSTTASAIISQLEFMGASAWRDGNYIVRARIEDDALLGIKAVRFRAELSTVLQPIPAGVPILRPGSFSPATSPDPSHLAPATSTQIKTVPLRCSSASYLPSECTAVVVLVHEKGSVSSSRLLFKRIKWKAEATGNFISVGGPEDPVVGNGGFVDRERQESLVV